MKKNCKICNLEFKPKTSETCCSFDCKKRNRSTMNREWKKENPDRIKQSNVKYNNKQERKARLKQYRQVEEHRVKERESGKRYRERNPEVGKNGHLLRNYNISLDEYNKMLSEQNNVCAICQGPETSIDNKKGKLKDLAVDHCHTTGKVRGLLCWQCNTSIGKFNDSIERLERAIVYLKKAEE